MVAVFVATIFSLVVFELVVRVTGVDWRCLKKNLFYNDGYHKTTMVDPDPEVMFRMRPNSRESIKIGRYGPVTITVNSLGARGPERSRTKPAGVFRIMCMGGSNVFGIEVTDEDTWPAQLEKVLNAKGCGKFEVWNYGTICHVGAQHAKLAWESLRYDPDLIIFAIRNTGQRAFFHPGPVESYFMQHPELWTEYLPWWSAITFGIVPKPARVWLFDHVHSFRYAIMGISNLSDGLWTKHAWTGNFLEAELKNRRRLREFVLANRSRVRVCFFVGPYATGGPQLYWPPIRKIFRLMYESYWTPMGAPGFVLEADGLGDEYRLVHPPPKVMAWYASNVAQWLAAQKLIPCAL
jgi:hypothetical protein